MKIHGICFAKNEADIIAQTLSRAAAWCDYIYVVDNNSCDRTWKIMLELAQQHVQIIPFRQEYRPFYDAMRGEVFHTFRDRAHPGDWWCRIDADEIYIDNPRAFLSEVPDQYQAVWAASFQYYFTDKDLVRYEQNPEAFSDKVPVEEKCRYYRNDWSENRFFRYDRKMVWDLENKSRSWPYFGAIYPKRIRLKHFQYRSPQQIQMRLLTRLETWSASRVTPIFSHEAQLAASKETNLWQTRVVKASDLTFDHLNHQYIVRDDLMPPVPRAYFPQIVNKFRYLKKHINKITLNKRVSLLIISLCLVLPCLMLLAQPAATDTSLMWQPLNEPGVGGRIDSITASPHSSSHLLAGGDILGARLTTDGGASWEPTFGWLSYELSDFTWHPQNPNVIWAGSLSGPHLSVDGGKTWTPKRSGLPPIEPGKYTAPAEKILFDPDSDDLLAFGGDHRQLKAADDLLNYGSVWHSNHNGESWSLRSKIVENGNILSVSYAGDSNREIYAAVWNHGAFYSDDDGKSWRARNGGLPTQPNGNISISALAVHPSDSDVLWASVEDAGLYKTVNGGRNWRLLDQGIPTNGTEFGAIEVAADGQTLYAGNKDYDHQPGIYKSMDGGSSWRYIFHNETAGLRPYPGGINPWWIEIDSISPNVVYAGTDNGIYRSDNEGEQWALITAQNSAQGWKGNGFSGLVARNVEWNPDDEQHVFLQGMDGAKMIQSWDGGSFWRANNPGLPVFEGGNDVAFAPSVIYGAFGQGSEETALIARSRNAGRSWSVLEPPIKSSEAKRVHVDPSNSDRLWALVNQQLWYSESANQTTAPSWTQLTVGFSDNKVGDMEAVPGDRDAFYVSTSDGVYRTDNGVDFDSIGGLKSAAVELTASAAASHILYAFQDNPSDSTPDISSGIWRYNPLDSVWSLVWNNPTVTPYVGDLAVHPDNANVMALVTNDLPYHDQTWATGVWFSRDAGQSWNQESTGLPMLRGDAIAFSPDGKQLVVGLTGAGFYIADIQ